VTEGHVILAEAPWALTLLSQHQFWPDVDLDKFGDTPSAASSRSTSRTGGERILREPAGNQCTREQIALEVWAQLKVHLSVTAPLSDLDLVDFFLDPAIEIGIGQTRNRSPLLTNTCGSWALRPQRSPRSTTCSWPDYVQTYTDLACMEGANEAGRRAVNGIPDAAHLPSRCDPSLQIDGRSEPPDLHVAAWARICDCRIEDAVDRTTAGLLAPPCRPGRCRSARSPRPGTGCRSR